MIYLLVDAHLRRQCYPLFAHPVLPRLHDIDVRSLSFYFFRLFVPNGQTARLVHIRLCVAALNLYPAHPQQRQCLYCTSTVRRCLSNSFSRLFILVGQRFFVFTVSFTSKPHRAGRLRFPGAILLSLFLSSPLSPPSPPTATSQKKSCHRWYDLQR